MSYSLVALVERGTTSALGWLFGSGTQVELVRVFLLMDLVPTALFTSMFLTLYVVAFDRGITQVQGFGSAPSSPPPGPDTQDATPPGDRWVAPEDWNPPEIWSAPTTEPAVGRDLVPDDAQGRTPQ